MTFFQILVSLLVLSALGSYLNYRYLKLPTTIALMAFTLSISFGLILMAGLGATDIRDAAAFFIAIDFDDALPNAMLAGLLFAGALHVDLQDLRAARWQIAMLSVLGVLLAALIAGVLFWLVAAALGFDLSFAYALLFGALIAPTDALAIAGIIRKAGVPKTLQRKIAGESLFNDGIAVVLFAIILHIVSDQGVSPVTHVALFLLEQAIGGLALGVILGWGVYQLLQSTDSYQVEILLTSAMVAAGYVFADFVHVSAFVAMLVAGLMLGNSGDVLTMRDKTRERLAGFWELVHQGSSAALFILIGLEIIVLTLAWPHLAAGVAAIAIALGARFAGMALPMKLVSLESAFPAGAAKILTWSAVRGGISVALALSLPPGAERELILVATYLVVMFSVLVQGLTFVRAAELTARAKAKLPSGGGKRKTPARVRRTT